MSAVAVQKGRNEAVKLGYNFTHAELHPNSNDKLTNQVDLPDDLLIDEQLVDILQTIRNYYGVPIEVNSTARTKRYQQTLQGGATNSQHVIDGEGYFSALDFDFSGNLQNYRNDFHKQVTEKTEFFKLLLSMGLSGVGLYDSFIHIDAGERRTVRSVQLDGFRYSFWDKRTKKNGDFIETLTLNAQNLLSMLNPSAEGDDEIGTDYEQSIKKNPSNWIVGLVVVFGLFYYVRQS
jgi:uncharacterized protein YcbK (DUF882 family)